MKTKNKKRKRDVTGWVYYWEPNFYSNENGILYMNPEIYRTKRELRQRMGHEWVKKSIKVRITIEEI